MDILHGDFGVPNAQPHPMLRTKVEIQFGESSERFRAFQDVLVDRNPDVLAAKERADEKAKNLRVSLAAMEAYYTAIPSIAVLQKIVWQTEEIVRKLDRELKPGTGKDLILKPHQETLSAAQKDLRMEIERNTSAQETQILLDLREECSKANRRYRSAVDRAASRKKSNVSEQFEEYNLKKRLGIPHLHDEFWRALRSGVRFVEISTKPWDLKLNHRGNVVDPEDKKEKNKKRKEKEMRRVEIPYDLIMEALRTDRRNLISWRGRVCACVPTEVGKKISPNPYDGVGGILLGQLFSEIDHNRYLTYIPWYTLFQILATMDDFRSGMMPKFLRNHPHGSHDQIPAEWFERSSLSERQGTSSATATVPAASQTASASPN
jgi:hypothetical protein